MGNVDNTNDVKLEGEPRAKQNTLRKEPMAQSIHILKRECMLPHIANQKISRFLFCRKEGETTFGPSTLSLCFLL